MEQPFIENVSWNFIEDVKKKPRFEKILATKMSIEMLIEMQLSKTKFYSNLERII